MRADRWPIDPTRGPTSAIRVYNDLVYDHHDGREIPAEIFTVSPVSSHIHFYLSPAMTFEEYKEEIDRVGGFLKGNPNITTLTVEYDSLAVEAKTYLLETLADTSKAGNKLDSLRISISFALRGSATSSVGNMMEQYLLERFLRSNRNLKRLDFEMDPGAPGALQFVTALASSNVARSCV